MTLRTIPATDVRVSPICLGTAFFGGHDEPASSGLIDTPGAYALLDTFVAAGGNFIDTARIYNDWIPGERSRSEGLLGRWMAERRNRNAIVLATKGAHGDANAPRMNAREIAADVNASLERLRVDVIDFYYVHRDDEATSVEVIIDALNPHVRAGKVRYLGCSNWHAARIRDANAYAEKTGQAPFVVNQPMWNAAVVDPARLSDQTLAVMDDDMRRMHGETGMACVAFSSQAGGLFKKLESMWTSMRFRLGQGPAGYPAAANIARYQTIKAIAARKSLSVSQVVLAYLTSQPFVTIPIVGCRTVDQLVDSLTAADVRLDAADLQAIDDSR